MHRMAQWITTGERPALPVYVSPFAKSASGSSGGEDDEDEDDEDDDDEDEDDDPDAEKSDEELREELKATRASLKKANDQSARRRRREREARRAAEAEKNKPKPKTDGDDDKADLDVIRREALAEGEKAGITRAKKAEAKASLLAAGVSADRVAKATNLLDLDDLDLDDDGLDGIDDAIEDLRKDWPELFAKPRKKRESVAGDRDASGDAARRGKAKTASERAADKLLGRAR